MDRKKGGLLSKRTALQLRQSVESCYWLGAKELNEAENVWKEVLNAAYPDLKSRNWESIPNLPAFPETSSEKDKNAQRTEVFQVGLKEFEWTPFPSVIQEQEVHSVICDLVQRAPSPPDRQTAEVLPQKPMVLASERGNPFREDRTEHSPAEQSKKHIPKLSRKGKTEMAKPSKPRIPTQSSQKKGITKISVDLQDPHQQMPSQNAKKVSGFERLFKSNSQSERKETEGMPPTARPVDPVTVEEEISVIEDGKCAPFIPIEKDVEESTCLKSCPMCCLQFPEQFSPLDIDSHLAMCLSESTEDIMW
ncbi:Fanconi anemia core complex-associated protein 20 isoform X2 [Lissotriton helveticus]